MGPPRYWKSPALSSGKQGQGGKKSEKRTRFKRAREHYQNEDDSGSPKKIYKFRNARQRSPDVQAPVYTRSKSPDSTTGSSSIIPRFNEIHKISFPSTSSLGYTRSSDNPKPTSSNLCDSMKFQPYQSVFSSSSSSKNEDKPETISRNFVSYSSEVMEAANLNTTADDDGTFSFSKLLKTPKVAASSTNSSSTSIAKPKHRLIDTTIDLCIDSDDDKDDSIRIISSVGTSVLGSGQHQIQNLAHESRDSNPKPESESTLMDISIEPFPSTPKIQYVHKPELEVIPVDLNSDDDDCKVVGVVTPNINPRRIIRNRISPTKLKNVLTPTSHNHTNKSKALSKKLLKRFGKTRWNTPTSNHNNSELIHQRQQRLSAKNSKKKWSLKNKVKNKILHPLLPVSNLVTTSNIDDESDSVPRNGKIYGKPRPIVVDGSNIAMGYGNGKFVCKGIEICVRHFQTQLPFKDYPAKIIVFIPQFRMKSNQSVGTEILLKLEKEGILKLTPSREVEGRRITSYDDRFILEYAFITGAIVVSNDNFRDLYKSEPKWQDTIKNRILPYTWADNILMFPNDPLGQSGPKLADFIRFEAGDPLENSAESS